MRIKTLIVFYYYYKLRYLINDIVDFTSISNNNLEINIRHHKIGEFVDEVYAVFKKLIEMK